jgi:hypothetical protein
MEVVKFYEESEVACIFRTSSRGLGDGADMVIVGGRPRRAQQLSLSRPWDGFPVFTPDGMPVE